MNRIHRALIAAALVVVVGGVVPCLRAEVSVETPEGNGILILGVIEGPDPIVHSQSIWKPVLPSGRINSAEAGRSHSRPISSGWL